MGALHPRRRCRRRQHLADQIEPPRAGGDQHLRGLGGEAARSSGSDPLAQRAEARWRRIAALPGRVAQHAFAGRRIASTGKLSSEGRPPASETMPGFSVTLRIPRITEGSCVRRGGPSVKLAVFLQFAEFDSVGASASSCRRKTVTITASEKATVAASDVRPAAARRPAARKGLRQLHLADAHHAAQREAAVPGEEASHIENSAT